MTPGRLCSPCDARLSVCEIRGDSRFFIKGVPYTLESYLGDRSRAEEYAGGVLLLFRLCVDDYHRFAFADSGTAGETRRIPGRLHTVSPIAAELVPIYRENSRCHTELMSDHFGKVMVSEVGALMVGRIVNSFSPGRVQRGEEKGYFAFGGSTVTLCLQKGRAVIDPDILKNSTAGVETKVRMGERIGRAI